MLGAGYSAFSAPTLYEASNTYLDPGSLNDQRWGTYSTTRRRSHNNANGFWLSNEYVTNTVNGPGGLPGWWDTIVAQAQVGAVVAPPRCFRRGQHGCVYTEGGAPVTVDLWFDRFWTPEQRDLEQRKGWGDRLRRPARRRHARLHACKTALPAPTTPRPVCSRSPGNADLCSLSGGVLDSVVYSSTSAVDATNGGFDTTARTITAWTATSAGGEFRAGDDPTYGRLPCRRRLRSRRR